MQLVLKVITEAFKVIMKKLQACSIAFKKGAGSLRFSQRFVCLLSPFYLNSL